MARKWRRILLGADSHCGHKIGLTHPDFNDIVREHGPRRDAYLFRDRLWKWYAAKCKELQPIDAYCFVGDAIEGKGPRSGGTELITSDRDEQCDMAAAVIDEARAPKVVMAFGTEYHVGVDDDWELWVAQKARNVEKIGGHDFIEVNGRVIDYRHYVASSSIPHGRFTPIAKQRLWNLLWAEHDEYPKADVIVRAHVHYQADCGEMGSWRATTLPALCGTGSKHGVKHCDGTVHFGLCWLDIDQDGEVGLRCDMLKIRHKESAVLKLY